MSLEIELFKDCNYHGEKKEKLLHDGALVKWSKTVPTDDIDELKVGEDDAITQLPKNMFVRMSTEEIAFCCPHLVDKTKTQSEGTMGTSESSVNTVDDSDILQMASEVNNLVLRARKVMGRIRHDPFAESILVNTMSILSAYAKIGSLSDCFRSSGAIDLVVELLSGDYPSVIRQSASELVRSLSAGDSANRMYVLIKLTQDSKGQVMPIEGIDVVLDVFFETSVVDIGEISLPQVPGRVVYSVLEKYLRTKSCISSLKGKTLAQYKNPVCTDAEKEFSCIDNEFNHFSLLFSLFTELFYILGWNAGHFRVPEAYVTESSIFACAPSVLKKKKAQYKNRSDFDDDSEYGQYIKSVLSPGMKVRSIRGHLHDHFDGGVVEEDIGEFKQGREYEGQFSWTGQGGRTTSVAWHTVEILPTYEEPSIGVTLPSKKVYGLPCLHTKAENGVDKCLVRLQWWEILCILQTLPPIHTDTVISIINRDGIKNFKDLLCFHVSITDIAPVMSYLKTCVPLQLLQSLSISHEKSFSSFYDEEKDERHNVTAIKECPPYPEPFLIEGSPVSASPSKPQPKSQNSMNAALIEMEKRLRNSWSRHKLTKEAKKIEQLLTNHPMDCKVAVLSLKVLQTGISRLRTSEDRVHCCLSGMCTLILKLMSQEPKSALLQTLGIDSFFSLMGEQHENVSSLPFVGFRHQRFHSSHALTIISTIISLISGDVNLSLIVDGIRCIVEYYNLEMDAKQRKATVTSVNQGLSVLVTVLNHGDYHEISQKFCEWDIPALLESIECCGIMVLKEDKLCSLLLDSLPSQPLEAVDITKDKQGTAKEAVLSVIKAAHNNFRLKAAILKLVHIFGIEDATEDVAFVKPPPGVSELFLQSFGVTYLQEALLSNNDRKGLRESYLVLLGCLLLEGGDTCSQVVIQGGLKVVVSILSNCKEQNIIKLCVKILSLLSQHHDIRVVMAAELSPSLLRAVKARAQGKMVKKNVQELIHLLTSDDYDLESISTRNKKILNTILYDVFDLVLTELDEGRRAQSLPCMPGLRTFFSVTSENGTECEKANPRSSKSFETIEVSSSKHGLGSLTDNNPNTYWQSSDSSGPHWIRLNMKKDTIIKKLCIKLFDGGGIHYYYQPNKVTVEGGMTAESALPINTVINPASHSGYFEVLGPLKMHYPVILLKFECSRDRPQAVRIQGLICECRTDFGKPSLIFGNLFVARAKLFHHIQSHTWASKSPVNLLDLFDRLSCALAYEQWFTDHYLFSGTSQRALGKACKNSLINPFLNLLSQNSTNEGFSDLLRQYFSHVQPSSSLCSDLALILPNNAAIRTNKLTCDDLCNEDCVGFIILMSRIRRMCRLLIDCNITPKPVDITQKNIQDGGKVIGILSDTWQKVIFLTVTTWLHQCDPTSHPLNVLTDFLVLYDRIKQVSVELFAGHSQLVLAIKGGFSQALLSLEQVSAIKLCECLCLGMDMLLNISYRESIHLKQVTESQKTAVLFRLVEPLQLLHNLDIAFAFEYFYRKLLIERVLYDFSLSLSFEAKLVHALAHCFPSKQLIQMLEDLDESQTLIQKFKHEHFLEKVDLGVQMWKHSANQHEQSNYEFIKLAMRMESYYDGTFHVNVLTPSCWPLLSRPLPSVPPSVGYFSTDYTAFYNSVFKSRGRHLEWSLYGGAKIICNKTGVVCSVSTVQMILLLAFNNAKEFSFQYLLEVSHLPSHEVFQALLSLTTNEHPILTASPSLEILESESISESLFSINETFLEKMAMSSNNVVFCISKHNTPCMRNADLAHIFQKRKTAIEASIVKVMKKEKELCVDTIANMVIRCCSLGQFSSCGRFECSYKEVISRIECLIRNGYLKRNATQPLILMYSPHSEEEKMFSIEEEVKRESLTFGNRHRAHYDMTVDDLPSFLMPSGTQSMALTELEKVLKLHISLLASVLSISNDVAECLLHQFAWNKDRLITEYLHDAESVLKRSGLSLLTMEQISAVPPSCPICLNDKLEDAIGLWCGHICCKTCWHHHFDASQPLTCTCPFNDCLAKPTRDFIKKLGSEDDQPLLVKFNKAVLHAFVEQNNMLTWCRNPSGCDQVLYCEDGMNSGVCTKCSWSSCFSCNFMEAHEPAACEHMRKWIESGGFYEGMDDDAKSNYLANTISKRCPRCDAQIEKTEGCLHIKCKCGCHFCWKCLKPWSTTHSDFFNCKVEESDSAKNKTKLVSLSKKCSAYHTSKMSAKKMYELLKSIASPMSTTKLSFLTDACKLLVDCYKMLSYACVAKCYFDSTDNFSILMKDLEFGVKELQSFLDDAVQTAYSVQRMTNQKLQDGYALVRRVKSTNEKILLGTKQHFKVSISTNNGAAATSVKAEEETLNIPVADVNNPTRGTDFLQALMFYRAMEDEYHTNYFEDDYYDFYNDYSDSD